MQFHRGWQSELFRTSIAPGPSRTGTRRVALGYRTRKRAWPNWTGFPLSAMTSAITPFVSALISFITFIASIMQTTVSSVTAFPTSTNGGASGEPARKNVPTIGETISLSSVVGDAAAGGPCETAVVGDGETVAGGEAIG